MWRLRQWGDILFVAFVTAVVLFISHILFLNLSLAANLDPSMALQNPFAFCAEASWVGWPSSLCPAAGWVPSSA
jgi:hypothetical protein